MNTFLLVDALPLSKQCSNASKSAGRGVKWPIAGVSCSENGILKSRIRTMTTQDDRSYHIE